VPATYLPGPGTLLCQGDRWLLLDRPPEPGLVARLWQPLPHLPVAELADLAAGPAGSCTVVDLGTGEREVRGRGLLATSAGDGVRLGLGIDAEEPWLPVTGGVVAAAAVHLTGVRLPETPPVIDGVPDSLRRGPHAPPTIPGGIAVRVDTAERAPSLPPVGRRLGWVSAAGTRRGGGDGRLGDTLPDPWADALGDTVPYEPDEGPAQTTVLAVECPGGHPTAPGQPVCRVCGSAVAPSEPVRITRPPLGRLVLPDGRWVMLDRGVVLGRQPSPQPGGEARPHLVTLPAEQTQLSRRHLEIELDGWTVVARDLDSLGGTALRQAGRAGVRMRPREAYVLERGHALVLSDDYVIRFVVELTGDPS